MAKTAIGMFDSRRAVQEVVLALRDSGFPDKQIRVLASPAAGVAPSPSGLDRPGREAETGSAVGKTGWLKIGGVPEEDAALYWEGVRRGSVAVVVSTDDDGADQAAELMDRYGAIDVEERCAQWADFVRPMTRAAGHGMAPPPGEGTVQVGRNRATGGGARVFVW